MPVLQKKTLKDGKSCIYCPFCDSEYKIHLNEFQKNQTSLKILRSVPATSLQTQSIPRFNNDIRNDNSSNTSEHQTTKLNKNHQKQIKNTERVKNETTG